jgi:hypothetical protein
MLPNKNAPKKKFIQEVVETPAPAPEFLQEVVEPEVAVPVEPEVLVEEEEVEEEQKVTISSRFER